MRRRGFLASVVGVMGVMGVVAARKTTQNRSPKPEPQQCFEGTDVPLYFQSSGCFLSGKEVQRILLDIEKHYVAD